MQSATDHSVVIRNNFLSFSIAVISVVLLIFNTACVQHVDDGTPLARRFPPSRLIAVAGMPWHQLSQVWLVQQPYEAMRTFER